MLLVLKLVQHAPYVLMLATNSTKQSLSSPCAHQVSASMRLELPPKAASINRSVHLELVGEAAAWCNGTLSNILRSIHPCEALHAESVPMD